MAEMQQKNVAFGSGDVPVSYGMTNTYFSSGDTLSGAVEKILGMTSRSRNHDDSMDDGYVRVIDPRTYGHGMKAKTIQAGMSREVITGLVNDSLLLRPTPTDGFSPHRVVFFGIGEGDVDTFLTPVGKIYGVELHAAAFASRDQPKWAHLASVVLDLLLAFLMGFWISYCWRRYYTYSTRMTTAHQQYAGAWALFMVAGVAGAVILAVWLSLWFMAFGIWLSPLPIAIGMFLEGCVTGPVTQACKELRASSARIGAHIQPAAPPSMAIKANIWRGVKICIWIGVVVWMVCLLIFH
jgi:hypothetical protein